MVSVHLTRGFEAKNAIDGSNATCWKADPKDAHPWWRIDLGWIKQVQRCEMAFVEPTLGHAWTLEKSSDGQNWTLCGEQKDAVARSPHIAGNIGATRYLRITVLAGKPGIWEFKVF